MQTSDAGDHDFSLAALNDGSLMTAGYFSGSLALADDGMSQHIGLQASGRQNGFLAQHGSDGSALAAFSFGENNYTAAYDIAPNVEGGFTLIGAFTDVLDLGRYRLESRGGYDAFVARFDLNGNLQWATPIGGPEHDTAYRLAPGINGGTWVGGNVYGNGTSGAYLALFTRGGTHPVNASLVPLEGGHAILRAVSASVDGGVFAAGEFFQALALDGRNTIRTPSKRDAFLARYSAGGSLMWGFGLGAGTHEIVATMQPPTGGVVVLGNFDGELALPGLPGTLHSSNTSAFVAEFNRNGDALWARLISGTGDTTARSFAPAPDGGLHITGSYTAQLYLGQNADGTSKRTAVLTSVGKRDVFAASFNKDGTLRWAQTAGGSADDTGIRIVDQKEGATVLADADVTHDDLHVGTGPDEIVRIRRGTGDGRHLLLMHYGD